MKRNDLMRRVLTCVLAMVMLLSLAACGSAGQVPQEGKPADTPAKPAEDAVVQEAPKELDIWAPYEETLKVTYSGEIGELDKAVFGDATFDDNPYQDLIKDLFNVELECVTEAGFGGGTYNTVMSLAIAAEELPDLIFIKDINMVMEMVENDLVEDLTEAFDIYMSDELRAMYDTFAVSPLEKVTFDGKVYALPRPCPEPENLIWIRQDWLEELNIELDKDGNGAITTEELESTAKRFMEADPDNTGNTVGFFITDLTAKHADLSLTVPLTAFGAYHGNWFKGDDGSVYYGSTVPEMKDGLGWLADMYNKGLLDPQFGIRDYNGGQELIVNGNCGIYFGEVNCPTWYGGNLYDVHPDAQLVAYALENANGETVTASYDVNNRFMLVKKGFEHPELVVKLANLYRKLTVDAGYRSQYPDIDRYFKTGNLQKVDPTQTVPRGLDFYSEPYYAARDHLNGTLAADAAISGSAESLIAIVDKYVNDPASMARADKANYDFYMSGVATLEKMRENGTLKYVYPILVKNTATMNAKLADLSKLEQEMFVKIITGEEPVEYFDTFVAEWKSRGGDAIASEIAEQVK